MNFGEAHINDQSNSIGLDGKDLLHWLPQAVSFEDEQVHAEDGGIESLRKEVIHGHMKDILEGGNSIDDTPMTSSPGGQQGDWKIDACKIKKNKGGYKHKGKKSKVTFTELLEKYQKESEAKSAHRPSSAKASRSFPRRKYNNRYWRKDKFNESGSYPPFGARTLFNYEEERAKG